MDGNAAVTPGSEVWSLPLEGLDPSRAELFQTGAQHEWFRRLRKEAPVHYTPDSMFGPYWSITRFEDVMAVDTNHEAFSSNRDIVIGDNPEGFAPPMFIAMDPPRHDQQRKVVSPAVAPRRLADLELLIRERVGRILDELPVGETFNWVDRVSIELTTQMLATLFDFPWEDRRLLPYWSDVTTTSETVGVEVDMAERERILGECLAYFTRLWRERAAAPPQFDFISLLAHAPETRGMVDDPMEFLGNLMLLIVGGNDTTRNSISGGVLALNRYPAEYEKLKANPALIETMVPEIIRWQTPLAHMRRTATRDVEFGGQTIKKGDRVVMWYVSANRDETVIENPDAFIIDRPRPRHHMSFGFGIHRCMGNRVAELQLKILWEEILKRFRHVEVVGEPVRVLSNFVQGYSELPVRLRA
ncbi:MAG: cytochrome P450 [Phenylobacterium sp.]|uniref:cytochrome P450 n=1 Tax=Phenylobacterium sp. TaxID=1871053 RepID=UPI0025DAD0FE|nr:cytochrome P450 [Phenylobacterium sp.]MBI1200197.1 cytochrome P450 [Phenylobacterium sp.]